MDRHGWARKGWNIAAAVAGAVALLAAPAHSQWITCEGPQGTYRVRDRVPCTEALQPADAARGFLDALLDEGTAPTAAGLAGKLEAEATRVCDTPAERGTMGPLYGVGRWGCDNGYVYRNFCQGYRLEKVVALEYGYSVLYQVTVAATGWDEAAFDSSSATLLRKDDGDVRITVGLSLRSPEGTSASTPSGYAETARSQRRGEARNLLNEILVYCEGYKEAYCRELRALASRIAQPASTPSTAPTRVVLNVQADRHRPSTQVLDVESDAVSLLSVAGTVVDDRGQPIEGATVRLEGTSASARTGSDGAYRVSAFFSGSLPVARRVDVTLSRATVELVAETLASGAKASGVAADGATSLTFSLAAHGVKLDSLSVDAPGYGSLVPPSPSAEALSVGPDGIGTLVYVAPRGLPVDAAKGSATVGTGSSARSVSGISVAITVRYVDLDGKAGSTTATILVVRPPLLVVGGFWAGPSGWTAFADEARRRGFDPRVVGDGVTWAPGTDSLVAWSADFARDVADLAARYAAAGLKAPRVDVVAHGVGGLVARTALAKEDRPGVGALVMVGTPNHGLDWVDQELGASVAAWLAAHPTASAELRSSSDALRDLNQLEASGAPLPADIDAANIVGRRPAARVGAQSLPATWPDDGIVSAASAHLDRVPDVTVSGALHAAALATSGAALDESPEAWSAIFSVLEQGASRVDGSGVGVELRKISGSVSTRVEGAATSWERATQVPTRVESGYAIRTGSNGAALLAIAHPSGTWGTISLDADTEVLLRASSPDGAVVHVVSGRVRWLALADGPGAGEFDVTVGALDRARPWYAQQPEVRLVVAKGEFAVSHNGATLVYALDEAASIFRSKTTGFAAALRLEPGSGLRFNAAGVAESETIPTHAWWSEGFWSDRGPAFRFPPWLLGVALAGLLASAVYHVRATRRRPTPRTQ
ncbi:MAG: alpha/beta fold hydrolase [Candidatus Bipolaricaulota bacterium]